MRTHKRVLLAEQSDTIRGLAGNVLRQSGFEVIGVATADKALEVLNFSRPDLLIVNGGLTDRGKRPLYERIQGDARFANVPLLLLLDPEHPDVPFPDNLLVNLPFEPKGLLEKVTAVSGAVSYTHLTLPTN